MILYNKNDKFLKTIISDIEKLPAYSNLKNGKNLFVYGISQEREYDVVLPVKFPNHKNILNAISNMGISTRTGCYWSMTETYNHCILGLGYNIRKNTPDNAKKVILMIYLSINGKIHYEEQAKQAGYGSKAPKLSYGEQPEEDGSIFLEKIDF